MDLKNINLRHWLPMILALTIGLIAVVYYVISGRSSLDANMRQLEKSNQVEKTTSAGSNTILVKCKNGEQYKIMFEEGQTNFQDLVYNKCGAQGAESQQ
ncbi:MAG: hypothetical protein WC843_03020 [Candidatus Gracilibacteria bacterium]|jgi:hypothetical protein